MRGKTRALFVCGLLIALIAVWLSTDSRRNRLCLSVQFAGYTNASHAMRVGVLQISNASPFAVVRGRGPVMVFDSPIVSDSAVHTGWNVLEAGECEQVTTWPLTNAVRWRLVVFGQRVGADSYGIGEEPRLRAWIRNVGLWLESRGVSAPVPGPPPAREFSSKWIEP